MKRLILSSLLGLLFLFSQQARAQQLALSGTVTDEKGEPLIGVSVQVKGTSNGTITNYDGEYSLTAVPSNGELIFTYIGFASIEVKVNQRQVINVVMNEDVQNLQEVVVVGFGTQKKVNLTGAVSAVSAEVLENRPVSNIGQALQGVIPNLNVSAVSANPSQVPEFNVRGGTSMGYNTTDKKWEVKNGSPLILVDGIEMDQTYLNMMNPNDIESISILKDAAASAIYGARATYGVMLITTKSGKHNQKARVNYSFNMQWNTPSQLPKIMDSYTHQLATNQATRMTQGTVSSWDETLLAAKKKYLENPTPENAWIYNEGSTTAFTWVGTVNPYKLAVRDWTPMHNHTVSISGGSEKTRYYISLGYQNQEGMYKINTDEQKRFNGLINLDTEITSWFKVATKLTYNNTTYNEPYMNPQKGTLWGAMKNEPGRNINSPIKSGPNDPIPDTWTDNIVGWLAYGATQETKRNNMIFNVTPELIISKELQIKAELSYRPTEYYRKRVIPTREYLSGNWTSLITTHTSPSSVEKWEDHADLYTINAYANFNKNIEKHAVSGVVGFNQEWYSFRQTQGKGEGLITPNLPVITGTSGNQYASDQEENWAIRGAFMRLNYIYNDRYLVEFNGRYDGTSRFGKNNRFKFFPSVSAGWRISEEAFMTSTREWLDNLKIRGSWGSLGNQNVDNYAYIAQYGSIEYVKYNMGGSRPMTLAPPGLIAHDLTWETATTLDFGVDVTLLQNRLDLSFDWYTRKTTDVLVASDKLPAILGTDAPNRNSGTLRTNGWEASITWRDKLSNGLRYDVGFVLSDYITEVVKFTGNPNKLLSIASDGTCNNLYDGMRMGEIWGYETIGILQESDFTIDENGKYILNGPSQNKLGSTWFPGDIRYKDIGGKIDENGNLVPDGEISEGDNTVENPGDRRIIGNNTPRFRFGLTGNFAWKNFDLNIFFQGVAKRDVWITDNAFWASPTTAGNLDVYHNSWTPENTGAKYPMYADRSQNRRPQTGYLFNGSYLRLKTLTLGYTLPQHIVNKIKLDRVRVNLSGYNLFEITGIPDVFDPEVVSSAYPMMRSVAIGVQVGF
ncbi:MAG: TonB-dependent receptor [Tannerellaceae bacterium]|nr:TonB-dependent receptor [Tannerellaceae bacterium]